MRMDSRREFLKKAAMLSGGAGLACFLPLSVQNAMAINPAPHSTYLDAEHVVILMQENRSFDHTFGRLQGVRGFNDPRAISLPNKNKVWLQTDQEGDTFAPFPLKMKDSKSTWMYDLPHSRESQVDAYNGGKYDKWLTSKKSHHKKYSHIPLTLGYYDRADIPFYYALADAFTVCDQNFCSSMTPTFPNRFFLWSGTIREKPSLDSLAYVRNSYCSVDKQVKWKTFPERLSEAGISWSFYQNEISTVMKFHPKLSSWLGNFGCNPLELYSQYNSKYSKAFHKYVNIELENLRTEIPKLQTQLTSAQEKDKSGLEKSIQVKLALVEKYELEIKEYSEENFKKLSIYDQTLHNSAFRTNVEDPDYLSLSSISYDENNTTRKVDVPKSDIFYAFRKDVNEGKLPMVTYLTAPQNFSDHPSAPWYGAWYVSEVLDILTKNPEVWKKTIFILCYDENDGYFDHIPPFSIPNPLKPNTGKVSNGIGVEEEYVTLEQDLTQVDKKNAREGAIGLGFRVPLVVASPWSRGGKVCSQIFDHTSIIQFLEEFTSHKSKKKIKETNISEWRRTICGNISTLFQPYNPTTFKKPTSVDRDELITAIHKAQYKDLPDNYRPLKRQQIVEVNQATGAIPYLPEQEKGTRPSTALPYELYADGNLDHQSGALKINFQSAIKFFGKKAVGVPFIVYAMNPYQNEPLRVWNYAVKAGDTLTDEWKIDEFQDKEYHLRVYGPNGFYREYKGNAQDPNTIVKCLYAVDVKERPTGDVRVFIQNKEKTSHIIQIIDNAYNQPTIRTKVAASSISSFNVKLKQNHNWYDFSVMIGESGTIKRFAGHVETGKESVTDPFMGRV